MFDYKKVIKDREKRLHLMRYLGIIPDSVYLKIMYRIKTGRKLNLNKPKGFNEKLNWLKVHEKQGLYTKLVDKYEVRQYVSKLIGDSHLFPILGVWDSFDEIDFGSLPDSFVLKCTHDSGSTTIIHNKDKMKRSILKSLYDRRLKINDYYACREYPYKDVKPRIIAEKNMCSIDGIVPRDYKFFCFSGEPMFMFVATDRESDVTHTVFDMDFNRLPIEYVHKQANFSFEKPVTFEKMKEISRILSKGMRFVRIDLYEIDGNVFWRIHFLPCWWVLSNVSI